MPCIAQLGATLLRQRRVTQLGAFPAPTHPTSRVSNGRFGSRALPELAKGLLARDARTGARGAWRRRKALGYATLFLGEVGGGSRRAERPRDAPVRMERARRRDRHRELRRMARRSTAAVGARRRPLSLGEAAAGNVPWARLGTFRAPGLTPVLVNFYRGFECL